MVVGLKAANAVLPSSLCTNPMPPLAGMLAIFKATPECSFVAPKDKAQVAKVGNYLAEWLASIAALVDKSMPIVAALFDAIPRGERGRWRGLGKTLLFDITCGLARRVPLTKLVELDGNIHPYLAALMVAALVQAGKTLVVPEGTRITTMTREAFDSMLLKEIGHNYDNYGLVSR